ncbi:uncharacterized protein zgc:158432 [Erpetoichthys calabaricus]|uniref:Uncharacterized LOC114661527 n=1 Tax=Erpetoichthys calabaricus TaxID=27687 RepID=A0A8C4T1M7_ERPCA|nr:uncharacterized protein zgc:158432 [Erpetoichthys calabaricus]
MAFCFYLGLLLMLVNTSYSENSTTVTTTTVATTPDPLCQSKDDYERCDTPGKDCSQNGQCYCKSKKSYCRCHNYKQENEDFWYIGENCQQLWSLTTLILVATLPGLSLAILVGVIIQCFYYFKKPEKQEDFEEANEYTSMEIPRCKQSTSSMFQNQAFQPAPMQQEQRRPQPMPSVPCNEAENRFHNLQRHPSNWVQPHNPPLSKETPYSRQFSQNDYSNNVQNNAHPPHFTPYKEHLEGFDEEYVQSLPIGPRRQMMSGGIPVFPPNEDNFSRTMSTDYRMQKGLPRVQIPTRAMHMY